MAILIAENGDKTEVHPAKPRDGFSLEEMYRLLDCDTVEMRYMDDGRILMMDEDGKSKNRPANREATIIAFPRGGDLVVGAVLLCEASEIK